jgi:Lrp/AsnC family transcriptional regulator, leucine-responsive regulatory protein
MNLDETDIKLLCLLQANSNLTNKELAAKVSLSPTPVFDRVKRLEKEGYIRKYTAILDADRLSKGFVVFCNIRLKQHSKALGKQFMEAITVLEEVTECYNISGEYDFMIKIHVQSMKDYQDFVLNTLGEIDSIGNLHSIFVMGTIKQSYALPLSGFAE